MLQSFVGQSGRYTQRQDGGKLTLGKFQALAFDHITAAKYPIRLLVGQVLNAVSHFR